MKQSFKSKLRSLYIGSGLLCLTAPTAVAGGGFVCLVTDPIWQAGHSTAQTSISTAVNNMAATFANQSSLTHEALLGALQVNTRQRSLGGEQVSVATTRSAEAAASVYVEQRAAELIREAHETYGPQGQMVGGCELIAELQEADDGMRLVNTRAGDVLSGGAIDAAPGSGVAPLEAAARRLESDSPEAVSAVSFFSSDTSSANRDAYMNNVIGLPFNTPDEIDGAEDELTFMQSRRWEAMRSPAIVSMAVVRASTEVGSDYLGSLDFYIQQFGGGPAYEEWSASLVTKSEAGILKEIARLRAINLLLSGYRQESQDRQLAVIATLLAGEVVR